MTRLDIAPRAGGQFFPRRGWMVPAAFCVLAAWLWAAPSEALAQAFPEAPFFPKDFGDLRGEAGGGPDPSTLYYSAPLPEGESFEGEEAWFFDRALLDAQAVRLTGDDPPEPARSGAAGSQYVRATWERLGPEGSRARLISSLSAGADEIAVVPVPLAPRTDWPLEYYLLGAKAPADAGILGGMGHYSGVVFAPSRSPTFSLAWRRNFPAPDEGDGSIQFDFPIAAREFLLLDFQRPPHLPADARLAVIGGASSRAIYRMPSPEDGFERLFLFGHYDSPAARALVLEWAPSDKYGPPAKRPTSVVTNRYEISSGRALLVSDREYRAPEGGKIESLELGVHASMSMRTIRTSVPARCRLKKAPDFWVIEPDEPADSLHVRVEAEWTFQRMERVSLFQVRDDSYCEREEVVVEGSPAARIVDSGYEGLWLPASEEKPAPRHSAKLVQRWLRSTGRRTGRWSFQLFCLFRAPASRAVHAARATYSSKGLSYGERIDLRAFATVREEERPRSFRLELNRAPKLDALRIAFEGDAPTTSTIVQEASLSWPGQAATAVSMEWDSAPSQVAIDVSYVIPEETQPSAEVPAPSSNIVEVGGRAFGLILESEKPLRLLHSGDFQIKPEPPAPRALPLEPLPATRFELESLGGTLTRKAFELPQFAPAAEKAILENPSK